MQIINKLKFLSMAKLKISNNFLIIDKIKIKKIQRNIKYFLLHFDSSEGALSL